MKPLEDWRVNRGMTGSFLCWKFKEKKAVLYKQTFLMEGTLFWMGLLFGKSCSKKHQFFRVSLY